MTSRFKFFAAAALGLVLATGTLADVSAKTATATHQIHAGKPASIKIAHKGHRLHVAHLRHAHKTHLARHTIGRPVAKHGVATKKEAGTATHRQHQAMNHRTGGKTSIVR
jgi:hypothetical protein